LKYIPQTQEDIDNKIIRFLFKPPCWKDNVDVVRTLYNVTNLNDTSCKCTSTNSNITGSTPGIKLNMSDNNSGCTNTYGGGVTCSVTGSFDNTTIGTVDVTSSNQDIYVRAENVSDSDSVTINNGSIHNVYLWTESHSYYCTIGPNTEAIYKWSSSGNGCWD
jgi:hypothetical protein